MKKKKRPTNDNLKKNVKLSQLHRYGQFDLQLPISQMRFPKQIQTGQRTHFCSNLITEFSEYLGIKVSHSSMYILLRVMLLNDFIVLLSACYKYYVELLKSNFNFL